MTMTILRFIFTLFSRLAAMTGLITSYFVAKMMIQSSGGIGGTTVRSMSYQNLPDGPSATVMTFVKWPGFLLAAGSLVLVPACVLVTFVPRLRRYHPFAWILLLAWVVLWLVGYSRMVFVFGTTADDLHIGGFAASLLATIGGLWGLWHAFKRARKPVEAKIEKTD